jgi:Transposase DDE domain
VTGRCPSVGVAGGMAALRRAQATPWVSPSEGTSTPSITGRVGTSRVWAGDIQQGHGLSLLMSRGPSRGLHPRAPLTLLYPNLCRMSSPSNRRAAAPAVLRAGRDPEPSVAIMDSQCVKTREESDLIQGYDGGKQVKGRKRHLLVDTLGLLLASYVTPANTSDQEGARRLLAAVKPLVPRLELIWADSAYRAEALAT